VNEGEFRRLGAALRAFHRRFAPLFGRKEARRRSAQYLRGLLVQQTDRRNAENLAEAVAGASPRALQRFLTASPWPVEPVGVALQQYLGERLGPPAGGGEVAGDGVFVVDATAIPKQGTRSVGVARQYCGALGKVANCQVGVFLGYASGAGHALVDAALWLPREWTDAPDRCRRAGVPEAVLARGYQSQAELARGLLRRAQGIGALAGQWVTADEAFGEVPDFRDALAGDGWRYVLEVPGTTPVFTRAARVQAVRLGPAARPRRAEVLPAAQAVRDVAAARPPERWRRLAVAEGAQGPRTYDFVALRVWESRAGRPGPRAWLVLRRNPDGSEPKYYLSNAPPDTPLRELARVGAARWTVETEFQHGKGEVGLDEYEVRSWRGWHHHMALVRLAGAFLLTLEQDWGGKGHRRHPAAAHPHPARGAAPPALDPARPAPLAGRHPPPQRLCQGLPRQTSPAHAA
jgi:SRSO17 transposase